MIASTSTEVWTILGVWTVKGDENQYYFFQNFL